MSSCPRAMASSSSWRGTSSQRQTRTFAMDSLAPGVLASRVARLEKSDLDEARKDRFHAIPDPFREDFAGRVLEARDLVQVVVIELLVERLPQLIELAEVD